MIKLLVLIVFVTINLFAADTAIVKNCIDGDTCWFKQGNKSFKVRLNGVDAPEKGQPYSKQSRDKLYEFLKDKNVVLQCDGKSFDRKVCLILVEGEDINLMLVKEGYVFEASKYSKGKYTKLQDEAREKKLGVWGIKDMKSPFCHRHGKKAKNKRKCSENPLFN